MVIIGTVAIYGLTAFPVARWLRLAKPHPQGVLIVGAHAWAQAIASGLQAQGFQVLLVDTNQANVSAARMAGLPTYYGSILSEDALDEIELEGIGRLLALTSNDEVNSLAALHFAEVFGRAEVYQLPPEGKEENRKEIVPRHLRGRLLFEPEITHSYLTRRFTEGAVIKATRLTKEFDYDAFQRLYGEAATLLFLINEAGDLIVVTANNPPLPRPGQVLISMVNSVEKRERET
jgi:hypothetical protein